VEGKDMSIRKLSTREIEARLAECPFWELQFGKLRRKYELDDFAQAIGFIAAATIAVSGRYAHHYPEWGNFQRRVTVELVSREPMGLTHREFELARLIEKVYRSIRASEKAHHS
jgi:4a-hydroxytetrahydrobiopterin dehydratase